MIVNRITKKGLKQEFFRVNDKSFDILSRFDNVEYFSFYEEITDRINGVIVTSYSYSCTYYFGRRLSRKEVLECKRTSSEYELYNSFCISPLGNTYAMDEDDMMVSEYLDKNISRKLQ